MIMIHSRKDPSDQSRRISASNWSHHETESAHVCGLNYKIEGREHLLGEWGNQSQPMTTLSWARQYLLWLYGLNLYWKIFNIIFKTVKLTFWNVLHILGAKVSGIRSFSPSAFLVAQGVVAFKEARYKGTPDESLTSDLTTIKAYLQVATKVTARTHTVLKIRITVIRQTLQNE